jgi:hypothetical protein
MKKVSRECLAIKPRTRDILDSGLVPVAPAEVNQHDDVGDYEGDN